MSKFSLPIPLIVHLQIYGNNLKTFWLNNLDDYTGPNSCLEDRILNWVESFSVCVKKLLLLSNRYSAVVPKKSYCIKWGINLPTFKDKRLTTTFFINLWKFFYLGGRLFKSDININLKVQEMKKTKLKHLKKCKIWRLLSVWSSDIAVSQGTSTALIVSKY